MSRILILGPTGSLGRHIVQHALAENHNVSVLTRRPAELPLEISYAVEVYQGDVLTMPTASLAEILQRHEVVINTAGNVRHGQGFVNLVDRVVAAFEAIPVRDRPVSWFLAGAGLLDIDGNGRKGVDLPMLASHYWPHGSNFDRIRAADLDWRILCPGPMTDQRPIGLSRLRVSLDRVPVDLPDDLDSLPEAAAMGLFAARMSEMVVPYGDAAALILSNLAPGGELSRHRVGLALPVEGLPA